MRRVTVAVLGRLIQHQQVRGVGHPFVHLRSTARRLLLYDIIPRLVDLIPLTHFLLFLVVAVGRN